MKITSAFTIGATLPPATAYHEKPNGGLVRHTLHEWIKYLGKCACGSFSCHKGRNVDVYPLALL